ncbi:MAG: hypothetical protein N2483_00220 [Burkholderiaceae bacterium]|nr:hypothetical protein [Burkholderiaceae bacterium]
MRDKAFEPLIDGLAGITGLSPNADPLKGLLAEGKAAAWDFSE